MSHTTRNIKAWATKPDNLLEYAPNTTPTSFKGVTKISHANFPQTKQTWCICGDNFRKIDASKGTETRNETIPP